MAQPPPADAITRTCWLTPSVLLQRTIINAAGERSETRAWTPSLTRTGS